RFSRDWSSDVCSSDLRAFGLVSRSASASQSRSDTSLNDSPRGGVLFNTLRTRKHVRLQLGSLFCTRASMARSLELILQKSPTQRSEERRVGQGCRARC